MEWIRILKSFVCRSNGTNRCNRSHWGNGTNWCNREHWGNGTNWCNRAVLEAMVQQEPQEPPGLLPPEFAVDYRNHWHYRNTGATGTTEPTATGTTGSTGPTEAVGIFTIQASSGISSGNKLAAFHYVPFAATVKEAAVRTRNR